MKSMHKTLVAAALLASLAGLATAQTPTPTAPPAGAMQQAHGPRGEHRGMDPARMQERIAQRQAALKQKLQITSSQEGAWTAWTTAMQPGPRPQRPDRAEFEKLTTPERIDRMRAMRTERMARMDKRADATKTFYAALTPEQKKVFDTETARMGGGRHGRGGRHHRG